MCFSPWVSLSTALIEFAVATFILVRYKDYLIPGFSAIIIYFLGMVQLGEFMVCSTGNPHFWTSVVFSTYSFLPAILLHVVLRFSKHHIKYWLLYIPALVFGLVAFFKSDFVISTSCEKLFIATNTFFTGELFYIPTLIYNLYYFGFILAAAVFWTRYIRRNHLRKVYLWWVWIGFFTIAASVILAVTLPSLDYQFPSIFCEFALFFTIASVASSEAYYKRRNREKLIVE